MTVADFKIEYINCGRQSITAWMAL